MTLLKFTTDKIICRLRWVMVLVMLADAAYTLIGQPSGYWYDPRNVNELEPVVRFFMIRGWLAYVIGGLLYIVGSVVIVSVLPRWIALVVLFTLLLGHFQGAASWILYCFRYSIRVLDVVEIAIAVLITMAIGKAKDEA